MRFVTLNSAEFWDFAMYKILIVEMFHTLVSSQTIHILHYVSVPFTVMIEGC